MTNPRRPILGQRGNVRGLLRSRQDDHRQVEHAGVRQALLPERAHQPAHRAAKRLRTVRIRARRRRRGPDEPDAQLHHRHVHRLGRRPGPRRRGRDAARHHRPAGVRRGRRTDRTAQGTRPRSGDRLVIGRRGRRADRCDGRCRRGDSHPDGRQGRQIHRRHRPLCLWRRQGRGHQRIRRKAWLCPRGLLRVLRLDHRLADARRGRTRRRGQSRPGAAQGCRREGLAGARIQQRRAAARTPACAETVCDAHPRRCWSRRCQPRLVREPAPSRRRGSSRERSSPGGCIPVVVFAARRERWANGHRRIASQIAVASRAPTTTASAQCRSQRATSPSAYARSAA